MRGGTSISSPDDILYGDLARPSGQRPAPLLVEPKQWWPTVITHDELPLADDRSYWTDCQGFAGGTDWGIRSADIPDQLIADYHFEPVDPPPLAEDHIKFLKDQAKRKDLSVVRVSSEIAPGLLELEAEKAAKDLPLVTRAGRMAILERSVGIQGEWRYLTSILPTHGDPDRFLLYVDDAAEPAALLGYLMI